MIGRNPAELAASRAAARCSFKSSEVEEMKATLGRGFRCAMGRLPGVGVERFGGTLSQGLGSARRIGVRRGIFYRTEWEEVQPAPAMDGAPGEVGLLVSPHPLLAPQRLSRRFDRIALRRFVPLGHNRDSGL